MSATNFNTSNETYKQLMARGSIFWIPRFQRDYSWTNENWEDLWADLIELLEAPSEEKHYMGYLVLQPQQEGRLDIIDGQQRMTTMSILVLSAMRHLDSLIRSGVDDSDNKERLEFMRSTYIGQKDAVSLMVEPKLTLNRNNNDFYKDHLTTLRQMPARNIKATEHLMRKATDWFLKSIEDHLKRNKIELCEQGKEVATIIDRASKGLFFTTITVDNDLNAYKVFETLNARGVKLSAPDLLKNYLFSIISKEVPQEDHDQKLDEVERRWSNIVDRLQGDKITGYLRTYWAANNSFVRESELFKVIKRSISTSKQAYALILGLEDGIETYLALTQPDTSDWGDEDKENARLLKLFSVRQPFGLLMAVHKNAPSAFSKILKAVVNITFRYNVISNLQANEQERVYSRVAVNVSQKKLDTAKDIQVALEAIYPRDRAFEASFSEKALDTSNNRNSQLVRYILAKIDSYLVGAKFVWPSKDISIEHIYPQNPSSGWEKFADNNDETDVYRLGNMILLEDTLNKKAGNNPFNEKANIYAKSARKSVKELYQDHTDWSPIQVSDRQNLLANAAKEIWKVENLSN